jgi:tartrate-resistant acid phosphatase type 5
VRNWFQSLLSNASNWCRYSPDGIASVADVGTFQQSFLGPYSAAASTANLTWHAVMGNHDYHGDVAAQESSPLARLALVGNKSKWDAMRGGYREFGAAASGVAVLGMCLIDTNPWVAHYRTNPAKYNMSWLAGAGTGVAASEDSWSAWEAAEVAALERCLSASNATWRVVVGHHPVLSYSAHHGSQPELVGVREVIERLGAAAYLNGGVGYHFPHFTLFCSQNKVQLITANIVHVTI